MAFIYKSSINIAILLCLILLLAQTASAQTVFQGSTWSEFPGGAKAVCADDDIDNDNDGLIELCYLEDVNAIRYNLQGNTYKDSMDATGVATGCPSSGCNGYELVRDLDFDDDDSYESTSTNNVQANWTTGSGWPMIEDDFSGILEGNGFMISNLFINAELGEFDNIGFIRNMSGRIQNLGLSEFDIEVTFDSLSSARVSALVANTNSGVITNCYVQGELNFKTSSPSGFILGNHSSFVSLNRGIISNSYTNTVTNSINGLFCNLNRATISDSYAMGDLRKIESDQQSFSNSAFVSSNYSKISNIYDVSYSDFGAAIVTSNQQGGQIHNSYWDKSRRTGRDFEEVRDNDNPSADAITNVHGFPTIKLQQPTIPSTGTETMQPYYKWSTENWDFGSTGEYPALKHAKGNDADNPACGTSQQPACGALLKGQGRNSQPRIIAPQNNDEIRISESNANTIRTIAVTVSDDDIEDELTLLLSEVDADQNLVMLETTKTQVMTNGKSKRNINEVLSIKVPQNIISGTTTLRLVAEDNSGFYNAMSEPILLKVLAGNIQPTITPIPSDIRLLEGTSTTLNVVIKDDNDDTISVSLDSDSTVATATITATGNANHILKITALSEGAATITVTMDDGKGEVNSVVIVKFTVEVEANDAPMLKILSQPNQPIELGATTSVGISIRDTNFDLNDRIALTVRVSTSSVVLVTPESISDIDSNTTQTFTLTGKAIGESNISFTATDEGNNITSVSVLLSVYSSLVADKVPTAPVIATVGAAFNLDTSTFFTYRGSGTLSYAVTALPAWLSFDTATGVLMVTPGIGDASLDKDGLSVTVTATDSNGSSAEAMFTLLINAEPSGMPIISFNANTWQLTADTSGVSDANGIDETMTSYQWFKGETVVSTTDSNTYTIKDNNEERAGGTEYKVDVTFVDNIGQEVTTSSGVYTVDNEAPVIPAIELEEVEEGERASITTDASDANHDDLTYTWEVTSRDRDPSILEDATKTDDGQISFDVPDNWVIKPSTATGVTETLELQVTVSDGNMSATRTAEVVVTKVDNDKVDTPSISVDQANLALFTLDAINLASDSDGADEDNANINYRWQRCPANADCSLQGNWADIAATSRSLTVTDFGGVVGDKFRVKITYTDKQGYRADDFFSSTKDYTGRADIKIRAKVFLEGPLQ